MWVGLQHILNENCSKFETNISTSIVQCKVSVATAADDGLFRIVVEKEKRPKKPGWHAQEMITSILPFVANLFSERGITRPSIICGPDFQHHAIYRPSPCQITPIY